MQEFARNDKYDILTPNGWEHFSGVVFNSEVSARAVKIEFTDGTSITATESHVFYSDGKTKHVSEMKIGDMLDREHGYKVISNLTKTILEDTYDIFNATNHLILTNDLISHQCDELAFVPSTIADAMWTSMRPTLATGGRAIITSTPNSDEDLFARIWNEANMKYDDYGNEQELGKNGFFPFRAYWYEHPDRDEKWRLAEVGAIGLGKFNREYACLSGDTILTMQLIDGTVKDMTISDVFELLKIEEAIDIITPDNLSGILNIPEIEPLEDMGAYEDVAFFGIAED